jgi:hypothetical protein
MLARRDEKRAGSPTAVVPARPVPGILDERENLVLRTRDEDCDASREHVPSRWRRQEGEHIRYPSLIPAGVRLKFVTFVPIAKLT